MQTTTSQGYPYPQGTDYGDLPGQLSSFAQMVDSDLSGWDAQFAQATKARAFRIRTTADSSAFSSTQYMNQSTTSVDFNNSGWNLQYSTTDAQSSTADAGWWFLGANLISGIGSGTVTLNSYVRLFIWTRYTDPVTGQTVATERNTNYVEVNAGPGGYANISTLVNVPSTTTMLCSVSAVLMNDLTSTRVIKAGTSFYGCFLGKANR